MSNNIRNYPFLPILCAFAILFTGSSCSQTSGTKLSGERIAFLRDGITTRQEVVETLGTPLYDLQAERIIAYSWVTTTTITSQGLLGNSEDSAESEQFLFCVSFDPQDIVQHHGRIKVRGKESAEDGMRRWLSDIQGRTAGPSR